MEDDDRTVGAQGNYVSDDYKNDELINVKLPRRRYELLNQMIAREEATNWLELKWRTHWVWVVGGGLVALFVLWDKIQGIIK